MTVDVEEWFQVENLKSYVSQDEWTSYPGTVATNIDIILNLFEKENVLATFFILGWIAEQYPDMVKKIFDHGHEIASHGYGHSITNVLNADQLYNDIKKSKEILEDIVENPIVGYRAPNFSINNKVVDILKNLNFNYDSSYNPFQLHGRYGTIDDENLKDGNIIKLENGLYEVPISTLKSNGLTIPIGGGAYFRIMPYPIFRYLVNKQIEKKNFYNFYLHPWEFEPGQPKIENLRWDYKFRHYTNLDKTEKRLVKFIKFLKNQNCRFLTIKEYIQETCN